MKYDERVQRVAEAILPALAFDNVEDVAKTAIAASDATLEVDDEMLEAGVQEAVRQLNSGLISVRPSFGEGTMVDCILKAALAEMRGKNV